MWSTTDPYGPVGAEAVMHSAVYDVINRTSHSGSVDPRETFYIPRYNPRLNPLLTKKAAHLEHTSDGQTGLI